VDNVKGSIGICVFVGCVNVLLGIVAITGALDSLTNMSLAWLGWLALLEGSIYFGLAFGIGKGNVACGFVAAGFYTLGTLGMIGLSGVGPGLVVRALFAWVLWKGALELRALNGTYVTRHELNLGELPEHVSGRPPWARRAPRPASRRLKAAAKRPRRKPGTGGHRTRVYEPRSVCPQCRDTFPAEELRCRLCRVELTPV
jgi:hypothetical protein